MSRNRTLLSTLALLLLLSAGGGAAGGRDSIATADLKTWLTYLSSDQLGGRQIYTEGLGLAAGYVQTNLAAWGVTPKGDNGTYLQRVAVQGVKTTSHSSVTVRRS